MNQDLVRFSKEQIKIGSKSFAMASFFFKKKERAAAWLLYSWCRYADDLIDKAPDKKQALERLNALESQTQLCFTSPAEMDSPQLRGLQIIAQEFSIPSRYALDLLRGMRMDVEGKTYESLADLEDYCYCVAGTVGLMMCHIMGVSSAQALQDAVAMGNAMQMTNIARDVKEDWEMGRIYFPRQWLREFDIDTKNYADQKQNWVILSRQLLREADRNYKQGWSGLKYLPFRAAWAVGVAGEVYKQIGIKVLSRRDKAWDARCYTTKFEKLLVAIRASVKLFVRFIPRLWRPHSPQAITTLWGET